MAVPFEAPGAAQAALTAALRANLSYSIVEVDAGTTYTVDLTDDLQRMLLFSNTSTVTVTVPNNAPVGFAVALVQYNVGQVVLAGASGATLVNRQSATKTAGRYAAMTLICTANSDGTHAEYLVVGDTTT